MSEYGSIPLTRTALAASDLSATRYHFLRGVAANTTNIASNEQGVGLDIIGVQQTAVQSGRPVTINVLGETKLVAGGSLTVNTWITTNGSGRAQAANSGDLVAGLALEAPGADGDVFRALVFPAWKRGF